MRFDQSRRKFAKVHLSLENDGAFVNHMRVEVTALPRRQYPSHHYETIYDSRGHDLASAALWFR
jgi:hypothetical protein